MDASFEIKKLKSSNPEKGERVFSIWYGISRDVLITLLTIGSRGGLVDDLKHVGINFRLWNRWAENVEEHGGRPALRHAEGQTEADALKFATRILSEIRERGDTVRGALKFILAEKSAAEN
jgi:hypothetical protein